MREWLRHRSIPPSVAWESIDLNSSSENCRLFNASKELSSCSTLRAPISAEVTAGLRRTQAMAICARLWPRALAIPFSADIRSIFSGVISSGENETLRVAREPSGTPFNSIVQLEREQGIPRNPFINAGAIVVSDVNLGGHQPRVAIGEIVRFVRYLSGDDSIAVNEKVAASEAATGFRNMALAHYMKSFGVLDNPVDFTLGVYFHHCALSMSCRQLAQAGRFLAHSGRNPLTGLSVVSPERARRINAVMLTCGHYDGSGEFAYRVGLPGKSGVGGGILAIAPGKASIAVWSPGLDASGNSHLGRIALEMLTRRLGWSIFGA